LETVERESSLAPIEHVIEHNFFGTLVCRTVSSPRGEYSSLSGGGGSDVLAPLFPPPERRVPMRSLVVLCCLATAVLATDQITFRGAYIGQPLSDWVDCSSGKAKSLKEGFKTHGKLCQGKTGAIMRLKGHTRILSGNGVSFEGEGFFFEDGKIVRIEIFVPDEREWEKVKYDLIQKLGPPSSDIPQVYQNGFGARWEYDQGFWVRDNIVAYAGIKVSSMKKVFGNDPATEGIEINITDAQHAKLPATTPSTLD
jgi:hypothetical protein